MQKNKRAHDGDENNKNEKEEEEDEFEEDYFEQQQHPPPPPAPTSIDEPIRSTAAAAPQQPPPFAFPESASTPITNHFDSILECLDFLRSAEESDHIDKQEVVDTMKARLHNMVSKILLNNTVTSMSMMGWKLE